MMSQLQCFERAADGGGSQIQVLFPLFMDVKAWEVPSSPSLPSLIWTREVSSAVSGVFQHSTGVAATVPPLVLQPQIACGEEHLGDGVCC